jgi:hypothetical protein
MSRKQQRNRARLVRIANARFDADYGAGVVAVSPDAPQLVLWRRFQRSCVCGPVTDSNRVAMLRQLNRATDTLTNLLRADWSAYLKNLSALLHRIERATHTATMRALDTLSLDIRPTVLRCVQTSVQTAAP